MREKYLNLCIDQPSRVPVTVQCLLHFWVLYLPDVTNWKQMWTMGSQSAVCARLLCPVWGKKVAQFQQDTPSPWWCSNHALYRRWYCFSDLSFRHGFCSSITSNQYDDLNNDQSNQFDTTYLLKSYSWIFFLFPCIFSPISSGSFDGSWPTFFNHSFTLQLLHCNLCFSSWQIM